MTDKSNQKNDQKQLIPFYTGVLYVAGSLFLLIGVMVKQDTYERYFNNNNIETSGYIQHSNTEIGELIDGTKLSEDEGLEFPFAVMIDNHPEARPQFGLSKARIIYEMPVEGAYTRLMAVYQNSKAEKIGPVRSARDYFLPWAVELAADYVHSGGSPQAFEDIERLNIKNIEEISYLGTQYFWRDKRRSAPNNLFTSTDMLAGARESLEYHKYSDIQIQPFTFTNQSIANTSTTSVSQIFINWSHDQASDVRFEYNENFRVYERWLGNKPHVEAEDAKQLAVSNVIIMRIPKAVVLDSVGRLRLDTTGSGDLLVFHSGRVFEGKWEKLDKRSPTQYIDNNNNPMIFALGAFWIAIVPEDKGIRYE